MPTVLTAARYAHSITAAHYAHGTRANPPAMSHFLFRFLEYNLDCISYPFRACYMYCNNTVLELTVLVAEHELVRPSVTLLLSLNILLGA